MLACLTPARALPAAPSLDAASRKLGEELGAAMDSYLTDSAKEGHVISWQDIAISNTLKAFLAAGTGNIDTCSSWLDRSFTAFEVGAPSAFVCTLWNCAHCAVTQDREETRVCFFCSVCADGYWGVPS